MIVDRQCIIQDRGTTNGPDVRGLQLQGVIDNWSNQHQIYALEHPPQIALLRIDRFRHTGVDTAKDRRVVKHTPQVFLPCFQGMDLTRNTIPYAVSALVIHHWNHIRTGHYTAGLFQKSGTMWATDDGRPSTCGSSDQFPYGIGVTPSRM